MVSDGKNICEYDYLNRLYAVYSVEPIGETFLTSSLPLKLVSQNLAEYLGLIARFGKKYCKRVPPGYTCDQVRRGKRRIC